MSNFQDKVAFITGGGSGIGRALGYELASRGARVVLADYNPHSLEQSVTAFEQQGLRAEAHQLDVRDQERFESVVQQVSDRHGRIDLLFNNAGIGVGGEARDYAYDDWKQVIDVNLYGVIHGIAAVYPRMVSRGSGHIINTASLAGLVPFPGEISYTSKYAVVGLSTLRIEAADLGVKVTWFVRQNRNADLPHVADHRFDKEKPQPWPKGISAERCARIILRGVARTEPP